MTAPLVFTTSRGGQTATVTLTPLGALELEYRFALNGRDVPADTDVAEFESSADRDQALAETASLYETNGYTRI